MPTYHYRCPAGHDFEKFEKMTAKGRARCPTCGRTASRQISGGAGLIFKGSGFYITDYGKDGKGPRVEKDSESKAEPAEKADKADRADQPVKADKAGAGTEKTKKEPTEKKSPKKKGSS